MKHKVVRTFAVTDVVVHDSQMLGKSMIGDTKKDGWADPLYRSAERCEGLKALRYGEGADSA